MVDEQLKADQETTEYINEFVYAVRDIMLDFAEREMMNKVEYELFCTRTIEMIQKEMPEFND